MSTAVLVGAIVGGVVAGLLLLALVLKRMLCYTRSCQIAASAPPAGKVVKGAKGAPMDEEASVVEETPSSADLEAAVP